MNSLFYRDCSRSLWRASSVLAARFSLVVFLGGSLAGLVSAQSDVVTFHYDISRSGLNPNEVTLTPANVNSGKFGKLFSHSVDGQIYAQPLYVQNVSIPGKGTHNVVFVATEKDSVYAFDADTNTGANANPLWQVSVIDAAHGAGSGATPVNYSAVNCTNIAPVYGISGTPTIDVSSGTMYLAAMSLENGSVVQRLHALAITTGAEKSPGPILLNPSVAGTGDGSVNGKITLDPVTTWNRTGLLLMNGTVYISFGAHCDTHPWHGWLLAYDASTLALKGAFNTTPKGTGGGIWMAAGAGLAADASGNIFITTGNGTYDGTADFGDSVMKMGPINNGTFPVPDWFTPYDQATLSSSDLDQGGGGVLLLPDQPAGAPRQHLLVTGGKDGTIYVLDRDNLGHFNSSSNSQVWQSLTNALPLPGTKSSPAWWNNNVYLSGSPYNGKPGESLRAFKFDPATGMLSGVATSQSTAVFGYPGTTPIVSANGTTNAIVWALQNDQVSPTGPTVLHAYDATNLANELYNSSQNLSRDNPGSAVLFAVPIVINGKVYVGTQSKLSIFGELSLLSSVSVNPASVVGGSPSTGTITLVSPAPSGGVVMTLHSSNTAVATVPGTVTLAANATTATFTISTGTVTAISTSSISATYSGSTQSATLTVTPAGGPPAITTTSFPNGTQNAAYSATLTATGGTTPYSWSISAGSLPTGLALASSTGVISGTPTGPGTSNFTVQVTDANSLTATKPLSLTVVSPALTVTTNSLPIGTQNAAYSATLIATGGTTPYSWSITAGTLPTGLALASSTGVISGTPTGPGTSNFTVQVTDANSLKATKPLALTINGVSGGGSGITLVQANAVQGSGVGSVSAAFPISNTTGNLILVFVRMSSSSQTVTLTDSANNTYFQAVAQVQNADSSQVHLFYAKNILGAAANTVTATFSSTNNHPWLAIYEFKGLSPTNPLDQTATAQGNGSTPSSGATPTTTSTNELVFGATGLSSTYSGAQTAGNGFAMLENDTASSPAANEFMLVTSTGSYTATFTLSGSTNWTAIVATFVGGASAAPVVTTTSLANGTQNIAYSATLTATGGTAPYSWAITAGTLPTGLALASSTGVISGTPTGPGTSNFTVQVTDANSLTATQPLSLTVLSTPTVSTTSLPNGTQNTAYNTTLAAAGGTSPYNWAITAGALPTGLALASSTGVISGTPTGTGTSNFTVQVTDANSLTATKPLSLTVVAPQLTVTTTSLPSGTQNAAYNTTLAATGGTTPYSWSISSGTLPSGLALTSSSGMISGTPTGTGTSNFTVQVTDANSLTAAQPLSLTVVGTNPPTVTTTSLPNGTQNAAYSATLTATGGTAPYTWSISVGTLPAGLALASSTGVISGTPTGTGTTNITVQVIDANSLTATKPLSLTIATSGGGGIALVQQNAVQGSGVGSASVAFPISNTSGNLILAFVRMSTTSQTVTLADSAGNTYVEAVAQAQTSDGSQIHLFYAKNSLGAPNTVTATFSSTNNHPWLAIYEFRGLNTINPLDQTASAQGSGTTPNSGATPTTTSANELVFAAMGLPSSFRGTQTAGAGFSFLQQDTSTSPAANESMLVISTGSYTATFTLGGSANWTAIIATFQ